MTKWIYDWPQIIDDLEADAYTAYGKRDVREASASWGTCACGNLCADIPLVGVMAVLYDYDLRYFGTTFADAISNLCDAQTAQEREMYAISARYHMFRMRLRKAELLKGENQT